MYGREDEIRSMLRRAQLVGLDDSGSQQMLDLTGLKFDRPRGVPRVMNYGHASSPPAGADFLLLALGGSSDRLVAIGGEHRDFRQANLPAGSSVLYDDKGNVIFAKGASGIVVQAREGRITVIPADGQMVFLGGNGADGVYSPVKTVAGNSSNVMAKM